MQRLLPILLILPLLFPPQTQAQANRWFGMEQADSTLWGWGLPRTLRDGFCLPGDTLCQVPLQFSFVATDTLELREGGYFVRFGGFFLSLTEVTQRQWIALMGEPLPHWTQRGDDLPATASPAEAQAFIHRFDSLRNFGFRLPTQEELDFAYSGGHYSEGYTYSGSNHLEWIAWTDGRLHPVAQKIPNELGIYDMDTHTGGFRLAYTTYRDFYDTSK